VNHDATQQQRTIFVTGASTGFGAAIVRRFAADGDRVVASARTPDRLAQLAEETGAHVLPLPLDVRNRAAVEQAISALPASFADIDVLINNAGPALGLGTAHRADLDHWEQMLDTNCRGLLYCTRAVLPGMVSHGSGFFIALSPISGWSQDEGSLMSASTPRNWVEPPEIR